MVKEDEMRKDDREVIYNKKSILGYINLYYCYLYFDRLTNSDCILDSCKKQSLKKESLLI